MAKNEDVDGPGMDLEPLPDRSQAILNSMGIVLTSSDELALRIAEGLLNADSPEELFAPDGTYAWGEIEGVPVVVEEIDWLRSSMADGLGFYALLKVREHPSGRRRTVTTGSTQVLLQLAKAVREGWLDRPLRLKQNATSNGYTAERLIFLPEDAAVQAK